MEIDIPPLDWKYGSQRIALIVAWAIIMFGEMSLLFAMGEEAVAAIPVLALAESVMLVVATFWLLKGCIWGDKIELNKKSLIVKRGREIVAFPLSELEELSVGKEPIQSGIALFRDAFSGGVVVSSDQKRMVVGSQLSQEEIRYLHNVLLNSLLQQD